MILLPPISTLFPYTTLFRSPSASGSLSPVLRGEVRVRGSPSTAIRNLKSQIAEAPHPCPLPRVQGRGGGTHYSAPRSTSASTRSEEHTSELQSLAYLVCRLL